MRNKLLKITAAAGVSLAMIFTVSCDVAGFKTVKIGNQIWMAENLNIDIQGSKCYEDNPENCKKYGRLYYYGIAVQACPKGWHLPSDKEWQMLVDFVGGEAVAGTKLKAKDGWNEGGNGTDDYGFSALPGGNGNSDGSFYGVGKYGSWSATEDNASIAWSRNMDYDDAKVIRDHNYKTYLFSVRCVQD
ncbi:hypothetical protein R83H12_01403 [Fibrobacteria bacterium R8-3-H12]